MGMFDTVIVKCPKCNEINYVQTKTGECMLSNYQWETLENPIIANGVTGEIVNCTKCDCYFELLADVVVMEKELHVLDKEEIEKLKNQGFIW